MDSDTSVIYGGEVMNTLATIETILEVIGEVLSDSGVPYGCAVDLKDDVIKLVTAVDSYIEDYEDYPEDPYLYNGVSRSDFF